MDNFLTWLTGILSNFGNAVIQLLPRSPFRQAIDSWVPPADTLGWLNWFFPVSQLLTVVVLWLAAVAGFYLFSVVLRWLKVIGD